MASIEEIADKEATKFRTAKTQDELSEYFSQIMGQKSASVPVRGKLIATIIEFRETLDDLVDVETGKPISEGTRSRILEKVAEKLDVPLEDLRQSSKAASVDALVRMTVNVERLFQDIKDKGGKK